MHTARTDSGIAGWEACKQVSKHFCKGLERAEST